MRTARQGTRGAPCLDVRVVVPCKGAAAVHHHAAQLILVVAGGLLAGGLLLGRGGGEPRGNGMLVTVAETCVRRRRKAARQCRRRPAEKRRAGAQLPSPCLLEEPSPKHSMHAFASGTVSHQTGTLTRACAAHASMPNPLWQFCKHRAGARQSLPCRLPRQPLPLCRGTCPSGWGTQSGP